MKRWSLVLFAPLISGCCHFAADARPRPATALALEFRSEFSAPTPPVAHLGEAPPRHGYSIQNVTLAVPGARDQTNRMVNLEYYRLRKVGRQPVIVILPISGGGYELERHFAGYFASRGFAAVIVHRRKVPLDLQAGEAIDAMLREVVRDQQRVLSWLETQREVDAGRIGLFGTSMGAIQGALVLAVDDRVRAAVLGMPGGNLPHILSRSTESGIVKRRTPALQAAGWSAQELETRLRQTITFDPQRLAAHVEPRRVLLVLAAFDTAVPFSTGWVLRREMGGPETILLPAGHYTALLFIPYIQCQALKFFQRRLGAEDGGGGGKPSDQGARPQ